MTHMVAQTGPPTTRSISIWTRGAQTSSALIVHGTQNKNSGTGADEGNLFGDYFYLEALTRLSQIDWIPYW
jgi:unsaturated chondroitin disaccharide hydrolase